jgi:hypothetical protein
MARMARAIDIKAKAMCQEMEIDLCPAKIRSY